MKKLLLCLTCAMLFAAACTTDATDIGGVSIEGAPQIRIDGAINQSYTTRVDDDGFCDGDQIGLFGVNYSEDNTVAGTLVDEGNQVDNARYTYDEASWSWISSGSVYYKDANTNIDLYAYYPYGGVDSVNGYNFEVAQDQSGNTITDGYSQSDFLWGKTENVVPSQDKVKIKFNHILACANVLLIEGNGFAEGEFAALEKSVLVMNTTRTAEIDLSTGIATPAGKVASEGIVMKSNAEGFRAIVVPQSVEAGVALFSITVDGISYRYKSSDAFTYEAGKQSKFTIKINKKEHSGEYEFVLTNTEIVDWVADLDSHGGEALQYYVVHLDEPGTLEEKIAADKKNPAKIKNLKVSGKLGTTDISFMRQKMTILQSINLKESRIIAQKWYWYGYINEQYVNLYFYTDYPSSEEKAEAEVQALYPNASLQTSQYSRTQEYEDDAIPEDAFKNMSTLINFVFPEKVTEICFQAFYNCSLLSGALIIPDDVVEIGARAFENCSNITSLALPPHLKKIKGRAFIGCSALSGNLELPSSLVDIDYSAFESCSGFTGQLVLPNNLTHLGNYAFRGCSGFTGDLVIPTTLTEIQGEMFSDCSGFNGRLVLHDGISKIEGSAFRYCNFQGELKLPANLLNVPDNCFYGCQFSTIAEFPKGLIEIGDQAFYNNSRLMGTLELPDELVALGERAFYGCKNLESVVLPAELNILKEGLFQSCNKLNKITCKATVPPIVQNYAFGGISKECIVEVPEESVTKYQADVNWGEFTHISAHHDFYLSRSKMRTLNAEHSRNFVLYAPSGFAWSIESCPEWVTVTPSSGVGKAEVTITVNQMTETDNGHFEANWENWPFSTANIRTGGRTGDVVFLLNDKDYRTKMTVEQYDYQYGDGDVLVNQRATEGNGVNIVFMGDCFDALDITMNWYTTTINKAIEHFFAVEPYKSYRDYFNVYTVIGMSNDSKVGTIDTIREGKFGSQYSLSGVLPDTQITYEYALKAETVNMDNINKTLIVMIENSSEYGGTTALWSDGSAIAVCPISIDAYPYDFRGIVQHEACGHAFAKLADETTCYCEFINGNHLDEFKKGKALGFYRNLELTGDMNKVGWNHLIFNPTYSNIVDVYEGGYYYTRGVYRSEPVSCMQNNIPYFSAISRQEAVERIMRYSGKSFNIDDFYANDVLDLQGNKATTSAAVPTAISLTGMGKQMPPKMMGYSPFDK